MYIATWSTFCKSLYNKNEKLSVSFEFSKWEIICKIYRLATVCNCLIRRWSVRKLNSKHIVDVHDHWASSSSSVPHLLWHEKSIFKVITETCDVHTNAKNSFNDLGLWVSGFEHPFLCMQGERFSHGRDLVQIMQNIPYQFQYILPYIHFIKVSWMSYFAYICRQKSNIVKIHSGTCETGTVGWKHISLPYEQINCNHFRTLRASITNSYVCTCNLCYCQ